MPAIGSFGAAGKRSVGHMSPPYSPPAPPSSSQQAYTTPGTYSFVVPTGVYMVSAVAVGGGAGSLAGYIGSRGAGGGGGLGWKNNIIVNPGSSYTVVVGAAGTVGGAQAGGNSYFITPSIVQGEGGKGPDGANGGPGGGYSGTGGGYGGAGGYGAGEGAYLNAGAGGGGAGYSGNGGKGGDGFYGSSTDGLAGNGGGGSGGGGGTVATQQGGVRGGGVGIKGQGTSGALVPAGGYMWLSGGTYYGSNPMPGNPGSNGVGGLYGAGCGSLQNNANTPGGAGAVRIIWGTGRSYPSTNTQDL